MKTIQLWSVHDGERGRKQARGLPEVRNTETEEQLEDILVESPDVLMEGLTLVGRQLPTGGGPLDLLGVDEDGRFVLFELKRGTLTRDAVAQILDYASDLAKRSAEELAHLIEEHSGQRGIEPIEDFLDWYARDHPNSTDVLDDVPRMRLVGLGVDDRAKRMVNLLADSGIEIQLLTFHAFESGGQLFLARQIETKTPIVRGSASSSPSKDQNKALLFDLAEKQGVKTC